MRKGRSVPTKASWGSGVDGAGTMAGLAWRRGSRSALSATVTAGLAGSKRSGFTAAGPTRSSHGVASARSLAFGEPPWQGPGACTETTAAPTAAPTHCRRHTNVPTGPASAARTSSAAVQKRGMAVRTCQKVSAR